MNSSQFLVFFFIINVRVHLTLYLFTKCRFLLPFIFLCFIFICAISKLLTQDIISAKFVDVIYMVRHLFEILHHLFILAELIQHVDHERQARESEHQRYRIEEITPGFKLTNRRQHLLWTEQGFKIIWKQREIEAEVEHYNAGENLDNYCNKIQYHCGHATVPSYLL